MLKQVFLRNVQGGGSTHSLKQRIKRGFTIMELVIVIAVIAVLAAVLIPTFANVIDRANQSSDQQAVYNMNISLAAADATDKPENVTEVWTILSEDGMDAKSFTALADDYKLVWDSGINRVLYVERETNTVVYPENYTNRTESDDVVWYDLGTGEMSGDDSWYNSNTESQSYTISIGEEHHTFDGAVQKISSEAQLVSFSQMIRSGEIPDNGKGLIIELQNDIALTGEWVPISEYAGIFNGNGKTISGLTMTNSSLEYEGREIGSTTANQYRPYGFVAVFSGKYFGNVTFSDVNINTPGPVNTSNHTVAVAVGAVINDTGTNIVDNVTVSSGTVTSAYRVAGIVGFAGGSSSNPMQGEIIISKCENRASITSTLQVNTYGTAAGILSTSNQMTSGSEITIRDNVNSGNIEGQTAGGIVGPTFGASSDGGKIYIYENTNSGDVTAHHNATYEERLKKDAGGKPSYDAPGNEIKYTDNGVYIFKLELAAKAAGIVTSQTDQPNAFVYNNTNTGTIYASNDSAATSAYCTNAEQIGYSTYQLDMKDTDTSAADNEKNKAEGKTSTQFD